MKRNIIGRVVKIILGVVAVLIVTGTVGMAKLVTMAYFIRIKTMILRATRLSSWQSTALTLMALSPALKAKRFLLRQRMAMLFPEPFLMWKAISV